MKVLVTGATGYVGSRLVPELVEHGHEVFAAVRRDGAADTFPWAEDVTPRPFDITEPDLIRSALEGMDAVVYLIHSMDSQDFVAKDREAAEHVATACAEAGVGRIVYLSGLIPDAQLSDHLRSRLQVEEVFLDGAVPATVLRAAMVIGAGSTSFEILKRLTQRMPFAPIPTWMRSKLQPVTIEEVVVCIAGALEGEPRNRHFDIGGNDVVTYPELLRAMAEALGVRRPHVVVPGVPRVVAGRATSLITGIDSNTVTALVDSLSHDMVCGEDDADRDLMPADYRSVPLPEALRRSLDDRGDEGTTRAGDVQTPAGTDPS